MLPVDYKDLDDKALFDCLQRATLAEKLKTSPEWKLLQEAADRIVERTLKRFALSMKADDIVGVIETQLLLKKYRYGLFDELNQLVSEGENVFEEAVARGVINNNSPNTPTDA